METTNQTQPTIPKFRRNSPTKPKMTKSVDDLLATVAKSNQYQINTNLGGGFKAIAEYLHARIIARNATKSKASIKINKLEFDKIFSSYECSAKKQNKERALRELLISAGIIAHATSETNFRDGRKDLAIPAQSIYKLLYSGQSQKNKVHEFIQTFAGLEMPNT